MKHTKGNWEVVESSFFDGKSHYITTPKGALGYYPAPDKDGFPVITWDESDAKLIAAAPLLLEALNKMLDTFDGNGVANEATQRNARNKAIKVIKKATE